MRFLTARILLTMALAATLATAQKKNEEELTQSLALPKDPPAVAVGEARRLVFHVSALSGKGLLSQQTRDALKALLKASGNTPVIHVRAFVAGSGDIRRVPQIVSEVFTEKRMALPAVSVVLAGALPLGSAQVVLESVSLAKKDVNPGGVQFVAGEREVNNDPVSSPLPLLVQATEKLSGRFPAGQTLRVTCFVSNLSDVALLNAAMAARFSGAVLNLVQPKRLPSEAFAQCEAVTRGGPNGMNQIAFTGTRVAFGLEEKDAALAWQRLDRDLREAGAMPDGVLYGHLYELHSSVADVARKVRGASSKLAAVAVEGLASIDAGFAVDAVAVIHK